MQYQQRPMPCLMRCQAEWQWETLHVPSKRNAPGFSVDNPVS
jgi:hypothetical protein